MKNHYLCNCGQENKIKYNSSYAEVNSEEEIVCTCRYCNKETVALVRKRALSNTVDIEIDSGYLIDKDDDSKYVIKKSFLLAKSSLDELEEMTRHISGSGDQSLNRLIFTQSISILESYFYNTLKALILNNKDLFLSFIERSKNINKEKYTLSEYLQSPMLPREIVIKRLNEIIYHNLNVVFSIYEKICNIQIKFNNQDRKVLNEAIQFRHDCSHRNGFNHQGDKLDVFTPLYINRISLIIRGLIVIVNEEIKDIKLSNSSIRALLDNYLGYYDDEFTDEGYPYFKSSFD